MFSFKIFKLTFKSTRFYLGKNVSHNMTSPLITFLLQTFTSTFFPITKIVGVIQVAGLK